MQKVLFEIRENERITSNVYKMTLEGDVSAITAPGQFVEIKIDDCFLRRPISVCDVEDNVLTVIYKTVGKGTEIMSEMPAGKKIDLLSGLGNGFNVSAGGEKPLLIGGGVGVPPLYKLCKDLIKRGARPIAALGFNMADEAFYEEEFKALGAETYLATADGSRGTKGYVTDAIKNLTYTYFYACGPKAMFRAVEKTVKSDGEYSFEERMGCGFGACMGCSCMTKNGAKRVCIEGPVLKRGEIIW